MRAGNKKPRHTVAGPSQSGKKITTSEGGRKQSLYPNTPAAKSRQRLLDAEGPFDNHCQQQRCSQDHRSGQL